MQTICTGWKAKHEPRVLSDDGNPTTQGHNSHGMCEECQRDFVAQAADPKVSAEYAAYVRDFPLRDPRD